MSEELFHAMSSLRFAGLGAPTVEDPRTLRPWFMRAKKLWQQQPWQKISPQQVLTVSLPTGTYQVTFPSPRQIQITDGQAPILLAYGFEPEIQPGLPEFFRSHRLPPSDHDQGLYPLFAVAEQANYVPVDLSVQETLLTVLKAVTEFLDLSALAPSIPVQATVQVVVDKDSTLMVPVSLAPPAPHKPNVLRKTPLLEQLDLC
jgi:hypothetical protein